MVRCSPPPPRPRLYSGPSRLDPGGKPPSPWPDACTGPTLVLHLSEEKPRRPGWGCGWTARWDRRERGEPPKRAGQPGGPVLPGPGGRAGGRCRPGGAGGLGDGPEPMGLKRLVAHGPFREDRRPRGRGRIDLARADPRARHPPSGSRPTIGRGSGSGRAPGDDGLARPCDRAPAGLHHAGVASPRRGLREVPGPRRRARISMRERDARPHLAILTIIGVALGMGAGMSLPRASPARARPYWLFVPLAALAAVLFMGQPGGECTLIPQFILVVLDFVIYAMPPPGVRLPGSLAVRLLRRDRGRPGGPGVSLAGPGRRP